jgi:pimeloyl-ACP methyl ester carboxylesterase
MPTIRLRDGRRLAYAEWGPADGAPVVYAHGLLGSKLRGRDAVEAVLHAVGVRWIVAYRPGFAGSDPLPGRRPLDFAGDLRQAIDHLGVDLVGIVAVSAGTPYALAAALALPDRVQRVAVVGAIAPPDAFDLRAEGGRLQRAACRTLLQVTPPTRKAAAAAADLRTLTRPWGLDLAQVRQPVRLWHGSADTTVGVAHQRWLAATLPAAEAVLCPGAGHLLFRHRLHDVLSGVLPR